MTTVLIAAITVLLALILTVLTIGLSQTQRKHFLRLLLWTGVILVVLGLTLGEGIWLQRDYSTAFPCLVIAAGIAANYGVRWLFRQWWSWPPTNWRIALFLRKIQRDAAPPLLFLTAKTVYIEDRRTLDMEGTAYVELQRWARFEVVADRVKAELVLSLSMKKPGANFNDWNGADVSWLSGEGRNNALGYSFLEVADPKQIGVLYRTSTVWRRNHRSATRDLIRQFRKEIRHTEKWYGSKQ